MDLEPLIDGILSLEREISNFKSCIEHLTLVDAALHDVKEALLYAARELSNSVQDLRRDYRILHQVSGEEYREQYKTLETRFWNLRRQLFILASFLRDLNHHSAILRDRRDRRLKLCMDAFISGLIGLVREPSDFNAYKFVHMYSYEYWWNGLFHERGLFILGSPDFDIEVPYHWPLIAHEIGHAYYILVKPRLSRLILPRLVAYMLKMAPTHVNMRDVYMLLWKWLHQWLSEVISDIFACSLIGASYTVPLIEYLQRPTLTVIDDTHPSIAARILVQLKYMERLDLMEMLETCKRYWESLYLSVERGAEAPGYPFDQEILEYIAEEFSTLMPHPPIKEYLDKILEIKDYLDSGVVKSDSAPLMVCGLALSKNRFEIGREVLKAIMEGL